MNISATRQVAEALRLAGIAYTLTLDDEGDLDEINVGNNISIYVGRDGANVTEWKNGDPNVYALHSIPADLPALFADLARATQTAVDLVGDVDKWRDAVWMKLGGTPLFR